MTTVGYTTDARGLRQTRTEGTTTDDWLWSTVGGLPLLLDDGTHSYIYGPSLTPIAQIDDTGEIEYLHTDLLGSVRLITDEDGDTVSTATYDEFGTRTAHTGTADSAFGFTGAWTDAATDLVHLRARDYDPATGQFLTVDPAADKTRQPYAYAGNNPLTRTDPTGLDWWDDVSETLEGVTIAALAGALPNAWYILKSDDPAAQVIAGWALGVSQASTTYGEGSGLVDSLRSTEETRNAQATIIWQLQNGSYAGSVDAGYRAGDPGLANPNFTRDASTYLGWEWASAGDKAKLALGSYALSVTVVCVDPEKRTAVLDYSGGNTTSLGSAIGAGSFGRDFWNGFAAVTGIGTPVSQTLHWREQVAF